MQRQEQQRSDDLRKRRATFQVIVACAACRTTFAALSRN